MEIGSFRSICFFFLSFSFSSPLDWSTVKEVGIGGRFTEPLFALLSFRLFAVRAQSSRRDVLQLQSDHLETPKQGALIHKFVSYCRMLCEEQSHYF